MQRHARFATAEDGSRDAVEVRHAVVDGNHIALSVHGDIATGYGLERRCQRKGAPISIQHLNLRDQVAVDEFIAHDPYALQLAHHYRLVLGALDARCLDCHAVAAPECASECARESELLALMRTVCEGTGAKQCFYHWFSLDDRTGDFESHRLLVGGAPAWAHRYVHKHWYLNDPAVAHARDDTRPLRGSALASLPDDHWLRQQADDHELRSNVFFPAHRRDDASFGLLHVSAPSPAPIGEDGLWKFRRLLRGLSDELLEWQVTHMRRRLAGKLSLSDAEVRALRVVVNGGSACHVAEELGLGERAVYKIFTAINRKFDSKHIRTSATKARRQGLLGTAISTNTPDDG